MFVNPPDSHAACGSWFGCESRTFMNGISVLIKPTEEFFHPFWQMRTQQKTAAYESRSRPSSDTKSAGTLTLDFPAPWLWEINVYCLSTQCMVFFLYQPEWTKTVILIWFVFQGRWKIRGEAGWREEKVREEKMREPYSSFCRTNTEFHEQPHGKHWQL